MSIRKRCTYRPLEVLFGAATEVLYRRNHSHSGGRPGCRLRHNGRVSTVESPLSNSAFLVGGRRIR